MEDSVLVAICFLGFFSLVFGIFYIRNRERMAMIERGMDPRSSVSKPFNHSYTLTTGFLLAGAGLGLFLAEYIANQHPGDNSTATYISLSALFGGIGLLIAYFVERKSEKKEINKTGDN